MVHGHQQHVAVHVQPQQADPQQRSAAEVKRPLGFGPRQTLHQGRLMLPGDGSQIDQRNRQAVFGRDHLGRLALLQGERGPQHLVPPHDLPHGPAKDRHVKRAADLDRRRNVVQRAAGHQLVQHPQSLLGE